MSFWLGRGVDGFYMRHTDRIFETVMAPYSSDNNDGSVSSSGDMPVRKVQDVFFYRRKFVFQSFRGLYRPGIFSIISLYFRMTAKRTT